MKPSTRRRRYALRARYRQLQQQTAAQRELVALLRSLTPEMQAALWYRLEDMRLLEREDVQEGLAQIRRGETVPAPILRIEDEVW